MSQPQRLETIPQPKYKVGDTVFTVYTEQRTAQHDCPDCLGTQTWKVLTKAGGELECECQRCNGWNSRDIPSLSYIKYVPVVRKLTIGSVRADSAPTYGDDYVSYMCEETGIGSGSVYYESKLFINEDEARIVAEAQILALQNDHDAKPEAIEKARFSHIKLKDAVLDTAKDSIWNSWYHIRALKEDIEEFISEGSLTEEQQSELESILEFSREYRADKMPMGKIIALLKEGKSEEALSIIPGGKDEEEAA
jgi:hypothetical protein